MYLKLTTTERFAGIARQTFKPKMVSAIKNYDRKTFMADFMAGIIVGIVALPLAIAFGISADAAVVVVARS